jgi:TPR repeat protein
MNEVSEERRAEAIAANEADRFAEAYRQWLPLAESGDPEAQGHIGVLIAYGIYRYESMEELESGRVPSPDPAAALADRNRGAEFLKAASAAGIGPASFNLAGLYVGGYGGGSWEDRKARAAELYALASRQGFTCFGDLCASAGPGQPYLDLLENSAAANNVCDDWRLDGPNNRRVTIVGLIWNLHSIEVPAYPLFYREFCVFLALTGGRGLGQEHRLCAGRHR